MELNDLIRLALETGCNINVDGYKKIVTIKLQKGPYKMARAIAFHEILDCKRNVFHDHLLDMKRVMENALKEDRYAEDAD